MGGVGSAGAWVCGWHGRCEKRGSIKVWRGWRGLKFWRGWRGSKKDVSGVGQNFGVGGVGLRCYVKKVLLKVSKNLQKSTCAGVSC